MDSTLNHITASVVVEYNKVHTEKPSIPEAEFAEHVKNALEDRAIYGRFLVIVKTKIAGFIGRQAHLTATRPDRTSVECRIQTHGADTCYICHIRIESSGLNPQQIFDRLRSADEGQVLAPRLSVDLNHVVADAVPPNSRKHLFSHDIIQAVGGLPEVAPQADIMEELVSFRKAYETLRSLEAERDAAVNSRDDLDRVALEAHTAWQKAHLEAEEAAKQLQKIKDQLSDKELKARAKKYDQALKSLHATPL